MNLQSFDDKYEVEVHHWQDKPLDEVKEVTTIVRNEFQDYGLAFRNLVEVIDGEYVEGLPGYRREKSINLYLKTKEMLAKHHRRIS